MQPAVKDLTIHLSYPLQTLGSRTTVKTIHAQHPCLLCPFAQEVWNQVLSWQYMSLPKNLIHFSSSSDWWRAATKIVHVNQRCEFDGMTIYMMWNLLKEWDLYMLKNKLESIHNKWWGREDLEQFKRVFRNSSFFVVWVSF